MQTLRRNALQRKNVKLYDLNNDVDRSNLIKNIYKTFAKQVFEMVLIVYLQLFLITAEITISN